MAKPHAPLSVKLAAKVLVNSGHSAREVARDLNVSPNSVSRWNNDAKYEILRHEEVEQIKRSLAGNSYKIAHRIQQGVSDKKIEDASLSQLAVSQAIFIEKGNLLSGLATQNISLGSVLQNLDSDRSRIMGKIDDLSDDIPQVPDTQA